MLPVSMPFGTLSDGRESQLLLLSNASGMTVALTDIGASIVSVRVHNAQGDLVDVTLGYLGARGYEEGSTCFGTTVGRIANRTANGRFTLEGREYVMAQNEGENNLHSGPDLWSIRLWDVAERSDGRVVFELDSPDGDQGLPGSVTMRVVYELTDDNQLVLTYEGTASAATPMSITNHSYWNLNGHAAKGVLEHTISVDAQKYLPTDATGIPLGTISSVKGTPLDVCEPTPLTSILSELPGGIDHNYCLENDGKLAHAVRLVGTRSGIALDVSTDAPGIQVYMSGMLNPMVGKDGATYERFCSVALEAQQWPDAIHHSDWPSPVFGPERPYKQTTVFAFSAE